MEAASPARYGTCMTMGTAAPMTAIAEALGMTLPGASSIPAADANHIRMARRAGRRIVEMVWEDLTPAQILTRNAFATRHRRAMAMGVLDQRHHPLSSPGAACAHRHGARRFRRRQSLVPVLPTCARAAST
jgi:dihydroxyacid dehydratase/phosphogluconate dehydratase